MAVDRPAAAGCLRSQWREFQVRSSLIFQDAQVGSGRKIDYEHGLAGAPASVIRRTQRRGTSCYHDKLLDQGVTTLRILLSFFTRVSVCQLPSRHAAHSSSYDIHHNSEN